MIIQRILIICLMVCGSVYAAQKKGRADSLPLLVRSGVLFSQEVTHQKTLREATSEPITRLEKNEKYKELKDATAVIWGLYEYRTVDEKEYVDKKENAEEEIINLLPPNYKPMHFLDELGVQQPVSTEVTTSTQIPELATPTNTHETTVELAPVHSDDTTVAFDAAKRRAELYRNLHILSRGPGKNGYSPSSRALPESEEIPDFSPVNMGPEEELQFCLER